MSWSTNPPKKQGWYLITTKDGVVMPAYRMEYPKNNFTWTHICMDTPVIANTRFPKPYVKGDNK